jgi:cold shock protein
MTTGTVKWFNAGQGFGSITPYNGGADASAIPASGFRSLDETRRWSSALLRARRPAGAEHPPALIHDRRPD